MKKTGVMRVAIGRLDLNEGQLDWLPRNPRQWTGKDIDDAVRSLDEDPDFLEDRPVLAVPGPDGRLVVFCHNLMTTAARSSGWTDVPCVTYEPENDEDRQAIVRRAIKDNGQIGAWDTDILSEWEVEPWQLRDWGVPDWVTGGAGEEQGEAQQGKEASSSGSAKEDEGFDPDKGILVRCRPGDVWELGDHRLVCGDSTDLETVKILMGGGKS